MPDAVIIEQLHKHYRLGSETIEALRGVDLAIGKGEFVAIMGASGSGKTTLLHLAGGLDLPDGGRVVIDDRDITAMRDNERTCFRRRHMGIVFQAFNLLPNLTARENVMLPMLVDGKSERDIAPKADDLIRRVRLDHRAGHRPAAMSGGEQQRVAIARALINEPILILADEPTGNLDPKSSEQIWRLLQELARDTQTTILMVTHEAAAASFAERTHVLSDGQFIGVIESNGTGDAALVATRYAELAV